MDSQAPLKILSLDGGGVRGLSSLLILESIMEDMCKTQGLDKTPLPCDVFDILGGTSTGGIIAIMLGRLRMSVNECIRAYKRVAQRAFTPKPRLPIAAPPKGEFSATALEEVIKETIREFCAEAACVAKRYRGQSTATSCPHTEAVLYDSTCTKTVVLAITKDNVDAPPTLFTTYDKSDAMKGCTIWQVARATSAATTFFKSIKVGRDEIEFIDAGFGYNNPCKVIIEEAKQQFPDRGRMQIISIGTGMGDVVEIKNTRRSILNALKDMATSSKTSHTELARLHDQDGQYYRLNVEQGLQDVTLSEWDSASRIAAHTRNYIKENEPTIHRVAKSLAEGIICQDTGAQVARHELQGREIGGGGQPTQMSGAATHGSGIPESNSTMTPCFTVPLKRNPRFVGREEDLQKLVSLLFTCENDRAALVGLGGIGKTQTAVEFAFRTKKDKPDHSVFWVPVLSLATVEEAYAKIATALSLTSTENKGDVMQLVKRHLSSESAGPWLLILDNADDLTLLETIRKHLPQSNKGKILVTSRFRDVAFAVCDGVEAEMGTLDAKHSKMMFQKGLYGTDKSFPKTSFEDWDDEARMEELLTELEHLPLAIVQAAAYLKRNKRSLETYLLLLRGTENDMVGLLSREFHDNTRYHGVSNAVAKTWLVSFDQIQASDPEAAKLLSFLSLIESTGIPQSMLPRAGSEEQLVNSLGTLSAYAFLAKRADSDVFDMHRLVQIAARIWDKTHGRAELSGQNAIQHFNKICPIFPHLFSIDDGRKAYIPHILQLLGKSEGCLGAAQIRLFFCTGFSLIEAYRFKEAINEFTKGEQVSQELADGGDLRLNFQRSIAQAYVGDGRTKEGINILQSIPATNPKTRQCDDRSQLISENLLAAAYAFGGQQTEAITRMKDMLEAQQNKGTTEEAGALVLKYQLAKVHYRAGRRKEAIELFEQVVQVHSGRVEEDDHFLLQSQRALAEAYFLDDRKQTAIDMMKRVLAVLEKKGPVQTPFQAASEAVLANAYLRHDRPTEGFDILQRLVANKRKSARKGDFELLKLEAQLAGAHVALGRATKGIRLLEDVVAVATAEPGITKKTRLEFEYQLGYMHLSHDQYKDAIRGLEHMATQWDGTLREDNSLWLDSQFLLAVAYCGEGLFDKAIPVFEHVLAAKSKDLAETQPFRILAEQEVARTCFKMGKVRDAIRFFEKALAYQRRTLAQEDRLRLTTELELARAYLANGQICAGASVFDEIVQAKTLSRRNPHRLMAEKMLDVLGHRFG